ncbi:MAG TPA: phosphatase PAP2 family protein [Firmicutes bacterium]|jgi:hypothetical protein|nr:phosphatase PAP2 family protein [Bacillota bacterium]
MDYMKRQRLCFVAVWFCLFAGPLFSVQAEEPISPSMVYAADDDAWVVSGAGTEPLLLTIGLDYEPAGLLQIDTSDNTALLSVDATSQAMEKTETLTGYVVLYSQDEEAVWRSAKAVAVASAVTISLKAVLGRARPNVDDGQGRYYGFSLSDDYHSMPSGHTSTAFAMARILAKDDPKHAYAYYVAAALVGMSRVQLKRHWPSDVIAGAVLGYTVGGFF